MMRIVKTSKYVVIVSIAIAMAAGCSSSSAPLAPARLGLVPGVHLSRSADSLFEPTSARPKYILVGSVPLQSILYFKATATGPAKPVATISGTKTHILNPSELFIDGGQLWLANYSTPGGSIGAFNKHKRGNIAPKVYISGSKTKLDGQTSLYVLPNGDIVSSNAASNSVLVFPPGSNGNVHPAHVIAGSKTRLDNSNSVWMDPTSQDILVASPGFGGGPGNGILAFSPSAKGNVAPLYTIAGSNTTLCQPVGLVIDSQGLIYVTNSNESGGCTPAILVFASGAEGNVAPIRTIVGSNTTLKTPYRIRVDALGYTYVTDYQDQSVKVFGPGANGNVAPVQNITNIPNPVALELQ
ncbi:MAG: hypothetical protein JO249_07845 [Acidobacteria bacterium]|nr:hypothetical protein [Acidobacteriota bacterium]